jgi:hypothetical protein
MLGLIAFLRMLKGLYVYTISKESAPFD